MLREHGSEPSSTPASDAREDIPSLHAGFAAARMKRTCGHECRDERAGIDRALVETVKARRRAGDDAAGVDADLAVRDPLKRLPRATPEGRLLVAAVREALAVADVCGVGRSTVAKRLGVSLATIEWWCLPGRDAVITALPLARMLMDGGGDGEAKAILPRAARMTLLARLAAAGGFLVVGDDEAGMDRTPLAAQVCQVMVAVGDVAKAVEAARAEKSAGGPALTRDEAIELGERVRAAQRELAEMAGVLDRVIGGGAGAKVDVVG
jgi:hypothetical protein